MPATENESLSKKPAGWWRRGGAAGRTEPSSKTSVSQRPEVGPEQKPLLNGGAVECRCQAGGDIFGSAGEREGQRENVSLIVDV